MQFRPEKNVNRMEDIGRTHVDEKKRFSLKKNFKETERTWHRCVRRTLKMKDILEAVHEIVVQRSAAKERCKFLQGSGFFSDDCLHIATMISECPYCAPVLFVDQKVKILTSSHSTFSTCCQKGAFKFLPLSEVTTALHQLLMKSD